MPLYDFIDINTGEISEHVIKMSEYDDFLKKNPNLQRYFGNQITPTLYRNDIKATGGFKEVLERIQRNTPGAKLNI